MALHKHFSRLILNLAAILTAIAGANAGILVLNGLSHEYNVAGGNVYTGVVELQNGGDEEQWVKVYQTDYRFYHTGETFYDEPGSHPRSNASWIEISPRYFALQPFEKTVINFQVLVPETDTLNGTYWSIIMVEGVEETDTALLKTGITVNSILRYGVQIITTVGETGQAGLDFLDVGLREEDSLRYLDVSLENTGSRVLRAVVSTEFFDGEGNSQGLFIANRRRIFPGSSAKIPVDISGMGPGRFEVLLLADCKDEDIFGMNLTLELDE